MTLLIKDAICYIDGKFKKSSVLIKDGLIHSLGVSISFGNIDASGLGADVDVCALL